MKITEHITKHITEVFEGNNWTEITVNATLQDVTYKEATIVTPATPNTIAALLFHLDFYNEVVISRLHNIDPVIDDHNGFNVPPIESEKQWSQLQEKAFASTAKLAAMVSNFPEEKLFTPTQPGLSTYYKTFHGIAEHTHYHLGQIMLLKKLIRNLGLV